MKPPRYLTPGLGGKSLAVVCVWALVSLSAPFLIDTQLIYTFGLRSGQVWMVGILLGLVVGLAWIATAIRESNLRTLARLLLVASFGWALTFVNQEVASSAWVRYTINLAGMFIAQSIFFSWARIPGWATAAAELDPRPLASRQFRIADLLGMMTAIGCLLGLAIRYKAPVVSSNYWTVLILIWCVAPIIAGNFALASLARSPGRGVYHFGFGLFLVAGAAIGITFAEQWVSQVTVPAKAIAVSYALIFFAFGATVFMLGLAGRVQAMKRRGETEPSTDGAPTT